MKNLSFKKGYQGVSRIQFVKESALYQGDERFVWWDPYKTLNLSHISFKS